MRCGRICGRVACANGWTPRRSPALEPRIATTYALLGRNMAAAVASRGARGFAGVGTGGPAWRVESGRRARGIARKRPRLSGLPDNEFLAEVARLNSIPAEVLSEPELLDMLLPTLRTDFELAETYQPLPGGRLDCPVVAYMSTSDPEVEYTEVLAWREVTTGRFRMRVFRGGHFYIRGGRPDVLTDVREDL